MTPNTSSSRDSGFMEMLESIRGGKVPIKALERSLYCASRTTSRAVSVYLPPISPSLADALYNLGELPSIFLHQIPVREDLRIISSQLQTSANIIQGRQPPFHRQSVKAYKALQKQIDGMDKDFLAAYSCLYTLLSKTIYDLSLSLSILKEVCDAHPDYSKNKLIAWFSVEKPTVELQRQLDDFYDMERAYGKFVMLRNQILSVEQALGKLQERLHLLGFYAEGINKWEERSRKQAAIQRESKDRDPEWWRRWGNNFKGIMTYVSGSSRKNQALDLSKFKQLQQRSMHYVSHGRKLTRGIKTELRATSQRLRQIRTVIRHGRKEDRDWYFRRLIDNTREDVRMLEPWIGQLNATKEKLDSGVPEVNYKENYTRCRGLELADREWEACMEE
ncbi:hypothetical protein B7494_g7359 [Chlorociboria aeruginascens]|nr:hypothetical protein B7494_g7359 [Chlorociboria aeruginascens]